MDSAENAGGGAEKYPDLDIGRVMEMIPHRYPILMIERVKDVVLGQSAVGVKNVSINEPFFQGHFPSRPVMPGVLIIESMAQTSAVLVVATLGADAEGKLVYFMTVDEARFRKPVTPGDVLHVHVTKLQSRRNVWKFKGEAKVNGTLVAEAVYSAMILDEK
ncbi:MAG TPA: 3-hydroxyacyl-ACP dehydratase FabZ [Azospirillaceae bacterium]|nr:3-hydroxyacyl-ACP dehydratase FabZ [Azospirillaceae bacterium]HRQ82942.1 3-hydroxyacyl-ACP dehydratase FabZ [Azospirillaceae bacterium]